MKATFYVQLRANRVQSGATAGTITSISAHAATQSKPSTVNGDVLVLKFKMDIPVSAFDAPEVVITLKDNPVQTKQVVADLQQWVADFETDDDV